MSAEKTEKPSKRKLDNARKKGQIFKSKDIIDTVTILTVVIFIKKFAPFISLQFNKYIETLFQKEILNISVENLNFICKESFAFFIKITIPLMSAILLISIISNLAQTGFNFSTETLKFDIKRIDPISGFKKMFDKKNLFELVKFLFKFVVITCVIYIDISGNITQTTNLIFHSVNTSTHLMLENIIDTLLKVAVILFIFSFFDYYLQKKFYMLDMRMSKQDLKDEYKQTEGDPLLKGKIKEKQREITSNTLIKSAQDATVTIVNPTHIAICIKYEPGMETPLVTAIARDNIALKLKEISIENGIPIIENIPLARALFNDAEIDKPIPFEYFRAVAEILVSIMTAK